MTDRTEPEWLSLDIAMAVHDRQLSEHGGPTGVRDQGALESALGRPVNQWTYGEDDLCALAAAYAFGIARNHPFTDGNKRTTWVFARLFLRLNGQSIAFTPKEAVAIVLALAGGKLSETELAEWFRGHLS
ncbi:type II toxin-antitoxin system death-on-curing family toxin [Altererythrobacter sp. RZ02]|uniref:Type II toxin-antitoxin system death-on-curing family toxin n=1 Tax=Pontixanthobacter rizhaonensis TaxID=2730337 RepID=A0A848QRP3_9SPHN|nr:type II toxin-antitoxin system death-on-curing family toxin [Pontixanthobacter rizhaonensis]NMW32196.1 type II toxin-antitoxin system death-on-curing family toxin [Pontixanthobacter rizhaonensis]